MIDVKKFVVVFLVLAALASSSALILLNFNGASSRSVPTPQFTAGTAGSAPLSFGNAFVPNSAQPSDAADAADAASSSDSNLTQQLADSLVTNMVAQNPNGPQDDGNGDQLIAAPDVQSVLAGIDTSSTLAGVQIPDWDFDAAMRTVRVASSSSPADIASYGNALGSIIDTYFVKTNLQGTLTSSNASPDDVSFVSSNIGNALDAVEGLAVPANLVTFDKGLIKVLVYEKNSVGLAENSSDDPVQTMVILRAEGEKYNKALAEFRNDLQTVIQNNVFSFASPSSPQILPQKKNSGVLSL